MFKRTSSAAPEDASSAAPAVGKGRPTPTRAEQEAARKHPLVPNTKEDRARQKADLTASRERARVGMANGDDKYLTVRDKGPQRRYARDFVDAGWHLGELIMPLMIVVLLVTFLRTLPLVQVYGFLVLWVFVLLVIVDMVITGLRVKRGASRKFGDHRERGLGMYAAFRTIQMRWMRLPKPQVKRGERVG